MNNRSTPDLPNSYLEHRAMRVDARSAGLVAAARSDGSARRHGVARRCAGYDSATHDQHRAAGVVVRPAPVQQHRAARVVPARKVVVDTHRGDEAIALPRFGAVFTGAAFDAAHARWEV